MLWAIAVSFIVFWLLGLVSGYTIGDFIHIALVVAIVAMLVQVEDDCSDFEPGWMRARHSKRRAVRRSGRISSKLAVLSGEKVSQPIISPQTYREEQPL